ncbi:MAG: hypothetical protein JXA60_13415 [Candidatus Coatesbacteria bacterium]|nr:hypothetical protein [Candidatus Coatesbacteria bacterium]
MLSFRKLTFLATAFIISILLRLKLNAFILKLINYLLSFLMLKELSVLYLSLWSGYVTTRCVRTYPLYGAYYYVQIRNSKGELIDKGPVKWNFWNSTRREEKLQKNRWSREIKKLE